MTTDARDTRDGDRFAPESLRLGLAGGGAIADVYLRSASDGDCLTLVALADRDEEVLGRRSAQVPDARMHAEVPDLIACGDVDAIAVALPHDQHAPVAAAALTAGKDVICEKPVALTIDDALELADVARRYGGRVVVRSYLRALEPHAWLKRAVARGGFGAVYLFRCLFASDRRAALRNRDDWHGSWHQAGGGVIVDSGYHLVDLARHLFGEVELVEAAMHRSDAAAWDAEDFAEVSLRHIGGTISHLTCSWTDDIRGFRWEREVHGSGGLAYLHDREGAAVLAARTGDEPVVERLTEDWWLRANVDAVRDCARALVTEGAALGGAVGLSDATATLRIVLAAYRSAALGHGVAPASVPGDYRAGRSSLIGEKQQRNRHPAK